MDSDGIRTTRRWCRWDSLLQSGGAVPVPSDVEVVGAEEAAVAS